MTAGKYFENDPIFTGFWLLVGILVLFGIVTDVAQVFERFQ